MRRVVVGADGQNSGWVTWLNTGLQTAVTVLKVDVQRLVKSRGRGAAPAARGPGAGRRGGGSAARAGGADYSMGVKQRTRRRVYSLLSLLSVKVTQHIVLRVPECNVKSKW